MNEQAESRIKRTRMVVHGSFVTVGFIGILGGVFATDGGIAQKLLLLIGSVFFGSSLAVLVGFFADYAHGPDGIASALNRKQLKSMKRMYHYYYVSRKKGQRYWRHIKIDLSQSSGRDVLTYTYEICDPETKDSYLYKTELVTRGEQIIGTDIGLSSGDINISVFPFRSSFTGESCLCGIHSHIDWNGEKHIDRAILSHHAIHDEQTGDHGLIENQNDASKLDKCWLSDEKTATLTREV